MKVIISRASVWGKKISPCEGAYRGKCIVVEERTVDDPKLLHFGSDTWFAYGSNHRVENGHIKRDMESEEWFLDIDDVWEFSRQYGDLIISARSMLAVDIPSIEIYDGYIE